MRMIKESDGERFECARSLNQSLTFVTAQQEFQRRGISLEEAQQRSLQLVEAFGTGLPRINLAYKKAARKPEIHVSENAFKIVLPNQNTSCSSTTGEYLEISEPEASYHTSQPVQPAPLHHQRILDYLATHPTITRPQAERLLAVSQATAARLLARMTSEGSLQRLGQGRDTYYQLPR